jgi:hypothetical protein
MPACQAAICQSEGGARRASSSQRQHRRPGGEHGGEGGARRAEFGEQPEHGGGRQRDLAAQFRRQDDLALARKDHRRHAVAPTENGASIGIPAALFNMVERRRLTRRALPA